MSNIQSVKQRFGIIGNAPGLDRAIDVAMQVAPTDISVLISGESGVGKEAMPQIIHHYSTRKHQEYIAVNCGAIPEGTIDAELFGHEKGAFTGAQKERKGYFEQVDGGTIFLDEVGELPLQTQVKLLRVLETGEFIRVGSSKVLKTNVRVVAATNVKMMEAVQKGKFREDLFYRLSTVPIPIPPLRERRGDIHLLFRKFAADFAEKYHMPNVRLNPEAASLLERYYWPGNIRQLKNVAERISVIEQERNIDSEMLMRYLPNITKDNLPAVVPQQSEGKSDSDFPEKDILYKVLFDMKKDLTDLKQLVLDIVKTKGEADFSSDQIAYIDKINQEVSKSQTVPANYPIEPTVEPSNQTLPNNISFVSEDYHEHEVVEESLSIADKERDLIKLALEKHRGKRKYAAQDLGISERTLYRKLKEYGMG